MCYRVEMTGEQTGWGILAWVSLLRAQQGALKAVEARLKRAGLPALAWYDVLLELERVADEGLRQRDIQKRMLLERYNVSRLIDRLEAAGLVTREPCAEDARGAVVKITDHGLDVRKAMWPVYSSAVENEFAVKFSDRELEMLGRMLRRLS